LGIATTSHAQPPGDDPVQIRPAHDAFVAACKAAFKSHQGPYQRTGSWSRFGDVLTSAPNSNSGRITSFAQAVALRKHWVRMGRDPVKQEIDSIGQLIQREEDTPLGRATLRSTALDPLKADWLADENCLKSYLAYLQVIQAPSLEAMQAELSAESNARVNDKVAQQQAAQSAAEDAQNELARQRKEADIAAAMAEEQALKHKREIKEQILREAEELPSCSGSRALQAIKDKFELADYPLKDIDSARDDDPPVGGTVPDPERHCVAHVSGKPTGDIRYVIRWRDEGHKAILLTFTPQS